MTTLNQDALEAERDDYREAYESLRENVRKIDVAMHGEDGAAQQASACDLIAPAKALRERAEKLRAAGQHALTAMCNATVIGEGATAFTDAVDALDAALADTQETDK